MDRIALLNTALFKVLVGSKLVEVVKADYTAGCIELFIEAQELHPPPRSGRVQITIQAASAL